MFKKSIVVISFLMLVLCLNCFAVPLELLKHEKEYSNIRIEPVNTSGSGEKGIAVIFEGSEDLHYYAKKASAPGGFSLDVKAAAEGFTFGEAKFPQWGEFFDSTQGKDVEVFVGDFTVFVPIKEAVSETATVVKVTISGIACTSKVCLTPFEKSFTIEADYSKSNSWQEIEFAAGGGQVKGSAGGSYPIGIALVLSFLAGLSLNLMPCIWPVLPIIVMRIVEQSKENKGRSIAMGLAFCVGILLFFGCLAGANIVLQVFYGTVLQWGDQFRNPAFVAGMAILLVVLSMFMFGVFSIGLPSSVTGRSGSGKGFGGSVGMGFLAAILSTPCSFGILVAAFGWAQTQPLFLATFAIMVMGVGMALPYAVLTSMPGLLSRLPRAGAWMELFKQAVGFILLGIAVWLIAALPGERRVGVLYFSVFLGFGLWMWGTWVSFGTPTVRKFVIRIIAVALVVWSGFVFLPKKVTLIDWQGYDGAKIEAAVESKRPVLIKFTADWCMSCKVVERSVYSRKDVAALIESSGVFVVKADTTTLDHEATAALKNIYHEPGVPVSVLILPGGEEVRWHDKFFADELKGYLEQLKASVDE